MHCEPVDAVRDHLLASEVLAQVIAAFTSGRKGGVFAAAIGGGRADAAPKRIHL